MAVHYRLSRYHAPPWTEFTPQSSRLPGEALVTLFAPCLIRHPHYSGSHHAVRDAVHVRQTRINTTLYVIFAALLLVAFSLYQDPDQFRLADAFEEINELHYFFPSVANRTGFEGVVDALAGMHPKELRLRLFQRSFHGLHLVQDVDAIPLFLEHPGQSADLTLDTPEPSHERVARLFLVFHVAP